MPFSFPDNTSEIQTPTTRHRFIQRRLCSDDMVIYLPYSSFLYRLSIVLRMYRCVYAGVCQLIMEWKIHLFCYVSMLCTGSIHFVFTDSMLPVALSLSFTNVNNECLEYEVALWLSVVEAGDILNALPFEKRPYQPTHNETYICGTL